MSRRRSALIVLLACGACTNLDGLGGGGDSPDASTDAGSTVDASQSDGGTNIEPDDASPDAADAGPCDVPGLRTRICDSFERSPGVLLLTQSPESWSGYGGSIALVNDAKRNGTVVEFLAGGDGGAGANADSYLSLAAGDVRRVVLRARLRIATVPDGASRQLAIVKVTGSSVAQVALYVEPGGALSLTEQLIGGSGTTHPISVIPGSDWRELAMDVDLPNNKLTLTLDGVSGLPAAETFPRLPLFPSSGTVSVSIGTRYSTGTPTTAARFDDVLVATDEPK